MRTRLSVIGVVTAGLILAGCTATAPPAPVARLLDGPILLTNDDGWAGAGITAVYDRLVADGLDVILVAPLTNQSGSGSTRKSSGSIAVTHPTADNNVYAVDGTPVDCVEIAITKLMPELPSLVISGVNSGLNVGRSIDRSGTVGAALAGESFGVPSIAVSTVSGGGGATDPQALASAVFVSELIRSWDQEGASFLGDGVIANVNVPATTDASGDFTVRAATIAPSVVAFRANPDGSYTRQFDDQTPPGSDRAVVTGGEASVTLLTRATTAVIDPDLEAALRE
jgi:5'/3'-nucleotidase SurE